MLTSIKSIPILTGKVAENFVNKANYNFEHKKGLIDFSKESKKAQSILKKSRNKGINV